MMYWFFKSITRRLILITSALFLFAFITLSFFLYHILLINYRDAYNDFFHNETAIIREILNKSGPHVSTALRQEVILEPDSNNYQYFIRIDRSGGVLIETPGISHLIKNINVENQTIPAQINIGKKHYALLYRFIRIKSKNYHLLMLQNISPDVKLLESVRHSLMLISFLFTLVFIFFSILLIKIGLKPLNTFVKEIKNLTPHALEPLDLKKLPSELATLLIEINNLIIRLKSSHEDLSSFSSNIAHELRTPINNLMISNERFLMKTKESSKINEQLISNVEEYQRISNLIDKLLFLARLSVDNKHFTFMTLNVRQEIGKVIEFHEALAEEKRINISMKATGYICADKDLFHNALSNILINAIKYSPNNSTINIHAEKIKEQLVISVTDEGPGLPEVELEKITTRFYRFNKQQSGPSGLGLGLSIVNSIMKALNAHLEIQRNAGVGLTVSMVFPVYIPKINE
jgi:two-component system, OmpR family, heavy metal sensor histidine kinase CusS